MVPGKHKRFRTIDKPQFSPILLGVNNPATDYNILTKDFATIEKESREHKQQLYHNKIEKTKHDRYERELHRWSSMEEEHKNQGTVDLMKKQRFHLGQKNIGCHPYDPVTLRINETSDRVSFLKQAELARAEKGALRYQSLDRNMNAGYNLLTGECRYSEDNTAKLPEIANLAGRPARDNSVLRSKHDPLYVPEKKESPYRNVTVQLGSKHDVVDNVRLSKKLVQYKPLSTYGHIDAQTYASTLQQRQSDLNAEYASVLLRTRKNDTPETKPYQDAAAPRPSPAPLAPLRMSPRVDYQTYNHNPIAQSLPAKYYSPARATTKLEEPQQFAGVGQQSP